MRSRALALCGALLALGVAAAYTVDCNHEYTDCDTELSKIVEDEDEQPSVKRSTTPNPTTTIGPRRTTSEQITTTTAPVLPEEVKPTTEAMDLTPEPEVSDSDAGNNNADQKPNPRLLTLNVDELQNFANALHNQTNAEKKKTIDLSDVTLDDDEDEHRVDHPAKHIPEKFFSTLNAPYQPERSEEETTCKENDIVYKVGEKIDRGCEESCECTAGGIFECTPRCKHPYIRRGRRLNDPLCFESPVDLCCSIMACTAGQGDSKPAQTCRYGNESHPTGSKWYIGCDQKCSCEANSVVTCQPRCPTLRPSDKCINVQDPSDACCEIQVCDVSQDAHETVLDNSTSTTTTPASVVRNVYPPSRVDLKAKTSSKVLVPEPIESVKILKNNTVQVNLPYANTTEPVHLLLSKDGGKTFKEPELMYSNLTKVAKPPSRVDLKAKTSSKVLVPEPIESVKILKNNTVQVNLPYANTTEPVHLLLSKDGGKTFKEPELMYSNLIVNLESGKDYILKTKETGKWFNFTTPEDVSEEVNPMSKKGCWEDQKFYEIGEEFHIGCSELCECTGNNQKECAALVCPNHVGLELMSKGCVRWAPSPPAQPPNCCPRSARCLSDGTCYYNGEAVPNWTEVPITLTGCEQRCFCENGELDCQEVCSLLPPVPPQSMRCPPMHRPAPVNISDEDCCKQWGCVPTGDYSPSSSHNYGIIAPTPVPIDSYYYAKTTTAQPPTTQIPYLLSTPSSNAMDFYKHLVPILPQQKINLAKFNTIVAITAAPPYTTTPAQKYKLNDNITVFTLDDIENPFKVIQAEPPLLNQHDAWTLQNPNSSPFKPAIIKEQNPSWPPITHSVKSHHITTQISHSHPEKHITLSSSHRENMHDIYQTKSLMNSVTPNNLEQQKKPQNSRYESTQNTVMTSTDEQDFEGVGISPRYDQSFQKVSMSSLDNFKMFLPQYRGSVYQQHREMESTPSSPTKISFFKPAFLNRSDYLLHTTQNPLLNQDNQRLLKFTPSKHITVLNSKELPLKLTTPASQVIETDWDNSEHVLAKQPNPYETVLLRAIQNPKSKPKPQIPKPDTHSQKPSALSLEHLLSQMELESEVNRNLGRDTNKAVAIDSRSPDFNHKTQPPFLPTIPPDVRYPEDEIPGYDQNNIHRPDEIPGIPPGIQTSFGDMNKKLSVISVESDSPNSVTMLLGLPSVLVGLRGSVDLRYTDTADEDVSHWYSQVFAPADEILTTPRLEFRLTGLKPSTTYKIRGKLFLHNLPVAPASDVYSVRTQDDSVTVQIPPEEKRREINTLFAVVSANNTTAQVSWRHFTEDELQYIDGVQVRFRPVGTPIYSMTELLHHSRSGAELVNLRPATRYEASLVLVPPPRATTELNDPKQVEFNTSPYIDPYNWTVTIEARSVGAEAAELVWSGVPSPAEHWVRVYRAAHACGDQPGKEQDEFKLATRDQPPSVTLVGLEANSRCRVWLELFLTNGKVKTSNVLDINTKSLDSDNTIDNEISASSISSGGHRSRGDYYSALVGVGVVAALGALTSLLLLLVVVRRHRPRTANITPVPSAPRESSLPPYDNPAYKLELQQETMDL